MKNNQFWIKTRVICIKKAALVLMAISALMQASAQILFWNTNGAAAVWTNANWSVAEGGPFTAAWTNADNTIFNAASTITYVTSTDIGNITVNVSTTVTKAGTLTTGGTVKTVTVADGATLAWTGQTFSSAAGTGFIKAGNGTWDMSAESVAYPGGFTLNAGTIIVTGKNSFGNGSMSINGGVIQSSSSSTFASASLAIGGDFAFSGNGNDVWGMATTLGAATRNLTNSTTSGSRVFGGVISGGAGVGLNFWGGGGGTINLTNGANSFSGPITINGAEVGFANDGSFGAVPGSMTTNAIVIDGGRMTSSDASGNAVSFALNASRGIEVGATAGTSISVSKTNGFLAYNGVITDKPGAAGILVKQGAGTLIVGGANTYSGGTFINNGTLQLTNGGNRLPGGTTLSLGQSADKNLGAFDLNGNDQQVAGLNSTVGTNVIANVKNIVTNSTIIAATLTISNNATNLYGDGSTTNSGIVSGLINLVKSGSGTQVLGDTNTYTGTTTVNSGILALTGGGSIGTSPVINLAAGGMLDVSARTDGTLTLTNGQTLAGFGTVTGKIICTGNSIIAPGNPAAIGVLTISSNVALNGTNILKLYKAGGTNDVLSAGGSLTYGGTLNVTNLGGTLATGDVFKLFNAVSYSGSFSTTNLPALSAGLSWTNTLGPNGTVRVIGSAAPISYLAINSINLSGTNLVIVGTNQGTGTNYILSSTNLAAPKIKWTAIATNLLNGSGTFNLTITNAASANAPQQFFMLGTTNNL